MSTVGEGRLEMGVSIVEGREMEDGLVGSSFLPEGTGSADTSSVTPSAAFLCTWLLVNVLRIASTSPAAGTQACLALRRVDGAICTLLPYRQRSL
jgi:hypothetical protein